MNNGEAEVFAFAIDGAAPVGLSYLSPILAPDQAAQQDRVNPQEHYTPLNCKWGTPKEQAFLRTHIMWKDETSPPIPSIRDTNEQIDTIFGDEPY